MITRNKILIKILLMICFIYAVPFEIQHDGGLSFTIIWHFYYFIVLCLTRSHQIGWKIVFLVVMRLRKKQRSWLLVFGISRSSMPELLWLKCEISETMTKFMNLFNEVAFAHSQRISYFAFGVQSGNFAKFSKAVIPLIIINFRNPLPSFTM